MRKIHIFRTVLLFALATCSGYGLFAQNMTEPYKVENGIAYKKSVSQTPDPATNEYTVTLETFVTGEVSTKQKPIPADIVLVLDVSGSMNDNYSTENTYVETDVQGWSYSSFGGYGSGDRYYLYEGNYYLVRRDYYTTTTGYWPRQTTTYHTFLYFNDSNNTPHYLYNNSIQNDRPSEPSSTNWNTVSSSTIFTGSLYRLETATTTRLEALKDAVEKFINVVKTKDSELKLQTGQTGNQIAIVKFAGDKKDETIDEGDQTYTESGYTYNYSQVVKQFKPVATNSQELIDAVNDFVARGATSVDYGLDKAQKLFQSINSTYPTTDSEGNPARSRTVVVFTDGNPTRSNFFQYAVAANAVRIAKQIKATSGDGACSATVFTVGVFGDDKDQATDEYMQRVSSNYPDADYTTYTENTADWQGNITRRGSITYTGNPLPLEDDRVYSIIVGNDKGLDEVFESIADISSGQNTSVGDDSILTLDVVSNSFKLPDGVTRDKIHVYTAQCLGLAVDDDGQPWLDEEGNQYLAFAERIEAKDRPKIDVLWVRRTVLDPETGEPVIVDGKQQYYWEKLGGDNGIDIDANISFDFKESSGENYVSVTGFNYTDYWCGLDEDHENTEQYDPDDYTDTYVPGYRGFKLIIEFPVVAQEDAVGGPKVATNDERSGIYQTDEDGNITGEPLIVFNRPTVKLPVNIWIKKEGLEGDDSAVITIYRYPFYPDYPDFDPSVKDAVDPVTHNKVSWEHFTKVMITKDDKIFIKDPDSEEGGYIEVNGKKVSGLSPDYYYRLKEDAWAWTYQYQVNNNLYTCGEEAPENPFVFVNTPTDVKGAEAKARNIFNEKKVSDEEE